MAARPQIGDVFLFAQTWDRFLVSESVAHLDHLVCTGRVRREKDDAGVNRYWLA